MGPVSHLGIRGAQPWKHVCLRVVACGAVLLLRFMGLSSVLSCGHSRAGPVAKKIHTENERVSLTPSLVINVLATVGSVRSGVSEMRRKLEDYHTERETEPGQDSGVHLDFK